jgi:hypothetical protein
MRRLARKAAPAEPTPRPATHGAEPTAARVPQQRSEEFEHANR